MRKTSAAKAAQKAAMDERRRLVVPLLRARVEQQVIAKQLGVDPATISRDVRAIRLLWQRECADIMNTIVSEDVAVLTDDERRWRAEMKTALESRMVTIQDKNGEHEELKPPDVELALKMYDRVLEIMDKRIILMGKKPPQKVAPVTPDGNEEWKPERIIYYAPAEAKPGDVV
jgi:hypothetical protein